MGTHVCRRGPGLPLLAAVAAALFVVSALPAGAAAPELPAIPAPAAIVMAQSFTLAEGFRYGWAPDMDLADRGVVLVLDVDPALIAPRQGFEPVLYAGRFMAQRASASWTSGRLVAVVAGDVDLATEPVWFGTPELPENVTSARASEELALALAAHIRPAAAASLAAARAAGGAPIALADFTALSGYLAEVTKRYIPADPLPTE